MRAASLCVVRDVCRALGGLPRPAKTGLPAEERGASRAGLDLLSSDLSVENASFSFVNSHGATQAGAQSRGGSVLGPASPCAHGTCLQRTGPRFIPRRSAGSSAVCVQLTRAESYPSLNNQLILDIGKIKLACQSVCLSLKTQLLGALMRNDITSRNRFPPSSNCMLRSFLVID